MTFVFSVLFDPGADLSPGMSSCFKDPVTGTEKGRSENVINLFFLPFLSIFFKILQKMSMISGTILSFSLA